MATVQECLICNRDTAADLSQDCLNLSEEQTHFSVAYIKTEDGECQLLPDPEPASLETFCKLLQLSPACTISLLGNLPLVAANGPLIFCTECQGTIQDVANLFDQVRQLELQIDCSRNLVEAQIQHCFSDHVSRFEELQGSHTCKTIRRSRGRPRKYFTADPSQISQCTAVEQLRELIVTDLQSSSSSKNNCEKEDQEPVLAASEPKRARSVKNPQGSSCTAPPPAYYRKCRSAQNNASASIGKFDHNERYSRSASIDDEEDNRSDNSFAPENPVIFDKYGDVKARTCTIKIPKLDVDTTKAQQNQEKSKSKRKVPRAKRKYEKRKPGSGCPKKKNKTKSPAECPDCSAVFPKESYLKYHRKKVHDMKHYLTFCSTCGKRFFSKQTLKTHLRVQGGACLKAQLPDSVSVSMEVGTPNYKCKMCGQAIINRIQMENHLANHANPKRYTCEICGDRFSLQRSLEQHNLAMHADPNVPHPFACSEPGCGRVFGSRKQLEFHEMGHRNEFHLCNYCPYKTVYPGTLSSHIRTVHEGQRNFKCPHCAMAYKTKPQLQKHIYGSHTAPEDRPFKCSQCPKTFPDNYSLNRHVITQHTNLKPLRCKICDRRFAVSDYLRVHMRTHTGKQRRNKSASLIESRELPAVAGAEIQPSSLVGL